jgi:hypothetical protein
MTISIHQPNFVPWLGYFYKIYKSDVFVILDNVQFTKNGFTNRNRIKTPQGELWLTVPIIQSGKFGQDITECKIFNPQQSLGKILKTVESNYKKAPGFELYFGSFERILKNSGDSLCDQNILLIHWIMEVLEISTKTIRASELSNITGESTDRLVSICKELKATAYLAGLGAKKYQEDALFLQEGINVINSPFVYPTYPQLWKEFMPSLSVLDVLFNCGSEAKEVLKRSENVAA